MTADLRCPFCSTAAVPPTEPRKLPAGCHRVQCDCCHRTYLLEVRVALRLWRIYRTRVL